MAGVQMFLKPLGREARHFFKRARFLEKMRCVRDDRQSLFAV
jgi:hypothetical protein